MTHHGDTQSAYRLGAIYPNDVWVDIEAQELVNDFRDFMPPTVELISAGTYIPAVDATLEAGIRLAENGDIEEAARRLMRHGPTCFAYYCTTISFARGLGMDLDIVHRITAATKKPATTTSTALIEALKTLRLSRVVIASPYLPDVQKRFIEFLEGHGIQVLRSVSLSLKDNHSIVPPDTMRKLAESADLPEAEAVVVGCTGQRLATSIEAMETRLGKPVLTANQVTSWHALRLMGLHPKLAGRGVLFSQT
ncbi:MAG: hypothetical protein AB1898_16905 [Acidobacteriota bacterium]